MGNDNKDVIEIEQDKICLYCNYFFPDSSVSEAGLGVCLKDEAFAPFINDIMESSGFASCYDLYLEKRFDGEKAACPDFEEAEIIEVSDDDDIYGYILNETLKHQKVDDIIEKLYSSDIDQIKGTIESLSAYIVLGNNDAYKGLVNYYTGLPPADSLEDVHIRLRIINALSYKKSEKSTINALVNELCRTSSNNTTRQLYTEILKLLSKCPSELVKEPLLQLLETREYSYKMKKRILEIIRSAEQAG